MKFRIGLVLLVLLSANGCFHLPVQHLPASWTGTPMDLSETADRPDEAKLQIIIAAGIVMDNHAALRMTCPGRVPLFWDAGGNYARETQFTDRRNDIIIKDPPDIPSYVKWREHLHDESIEIFEWNLDAAQACRLYDILVHGTDKDHPAGKFRSSTPGLFCSTAISDFLMRFAGETITLEETYFWPSELAGALYTQSPDRVIVIRPKASIKAYTQPSSIAGGPPSTAKKDRPEVHALPSHEITN